MRCELARDLVGNSLSDRQMLIYFLIILSGFVSFGVGLLILLLVLAASIRVRSVEQKRHKKCRAR